MFLRFALTMFTIIFSNVSSWRLKTFRENITIGISNKTVKTKHSWHSLNA